MVCTPHELKRLNQHLLKNLEVLPTVQGSEVIME